MSAILSFAVHRIKYHEIHHGEPFTTWTFRRKRLCHAHCPFNHKSPNTITSNQLTKPTINMELYTFTTMASLPVPKLSFKEKRADSFFAWASPAEAAAAQASQLAWVREYRRWMMRYHTVAHFKAMSGTDDLNVAMANAYKKPRAARKNPTPPAAAPAAPEAAPSSRPVVGNYPNPPDSQSKPSTRMKGMLSGLSRLSTAPEPETPEASPVQLPSWWVHSPELELVSPYVARVTRNVQIALLEADRLGMDCWDYLQMVERERRGASEA